MFRLKKNPLLHLTGFRSRESQGQESSIKEKQKERKKGRKEGKIERKNKHKINRFIFEKKTSNDKNVL